MISYHGHHYAYNHKISIPERSITMPNTRHYTRYIAKDADFQTLALIISAIEEEHTECSKLIPDHTFTFDIICLFTGEVLACRDAHGLWEINR